jgi:hypothetical protein
MRRLRSQLRGCCPQPTLTATPHACAAAGARDPGTAQARHSALRAQAGPNAACLLRTEPLWLARALGLACSVAFMLWTGAVHPPGGALVLIFADSAQARTARERSAG